MKRLPILSTLLVALAVATMVALGLWQLQRKTWKEHLLARYATNETLPPIAFPEASFGDEHLFRKTYATCAAASDWVREVGRSADGTIGWRQIARCTRPGSGAPFFVQLGVSSDPEWQPTWHGGPLTGFISHAPDHRSLIEDMVSKSRPQPLLLVADTPPEGLMPNSGPDRSGVPNNHFAYAMQWFIFAGLAALIYALALRRRGRVLVTPPTRG
ncbi:SURF1 family protein [Hephaestia sp. GCM10023244]|uniref:SURF1 family protein n=1 Tax=unclassified Hephaestia TaxID=2631281 RepID=UPI0020777823|nr:SURF1 family protein [Hephaestia sp. MAHUQ-44]MCM8730485.1 SURF1 family protein [Hephaestia sp. MAHUQ-44]